MAIKLQLYYPVKPFHLNQPFGGNIPCVKQDYSIPVDKRQIISGADNFTCPVGYEKLYPLLGMPAGHTGADLAAGEQNIYSSQEGIVTEIQSEPARGEGIGITTENEYDLGEYGNHQVKIRYWHLKKIYVVMGQKVKAGDLIGISDNTGYSSGNHVHMEAKPQSKDINGYYYNTFKDNQFFGAIDPVPYFNGLYAEDIALGTTLPYKHTFYLPLKFGDEGSEVLALQRCLQSIGYFPSTVTPDGHYGPITRGAVFAFQKDHVITNVFSFIEVWSRWGNNIGMFTLPVLNKYFA